MRVLGKMLKAAKISSCPFCQALNVMLRNYRATPHSTTGVAPATLLLGRVMKVKIPDMSSPPSDNQLRTHTWAKKEKMNTRISAQRHARPRNLQVGDFVLVKEQNTGKTTSLYEPTPYCIIHRNGPEVSARNTNTGRVVTRNISFFKAIPTPVVQPQQSLHKAMQLP